MPIEPAPPLEYPIGRLRRLKFFLERVDFGRTIALRMATQADPDTGKVAVATSVRFEVIDEFEAAPSPDPLRLSLDSAQQLMDELWHCGVRPSEGSGSAGALAATQHHLKDMQRIAFKLLHEEQELADRARMHGLPQNPLFTGEIR